jgi:hypothetical protein
MLLIGGTWNLLIRSWKDGLTRSAGALASYEGTGASWCAAAGGESEVTASLP